MMRKIGFVFLFGLVFGSILVSCGGSEGKKKDEASVKAKIGVAIYKFDDTFMSAVRNTIDAEGKEKAELLIVDSQNSQTTQNDQVDSFLSKGTKGVAVNPVDRTAAGALIGKVKNEGVPIVFFNREPFAADMQTYDKAYYVGAKAEESGTMQGEIVVEYFKNNPSADKNGDGVIQYIMLKGEPGHQDAELRTQYSIEAITNAGMKVEKIAEDTAMWDRVKGQEKMAAFLAAHGDKIEVVLTNNDDMALGAIEALKAEGYFKGDKYLPVVGVDATAPALKALEEGTLLGTVLNDAKNQGKATFDLIYALINGEAADSISYKITDGKYFWVPYQKVTKDNYKEFQ